MSHYPKPDSYSKNKIKIAFHLSNYARKSDLKKPIGVDTSNFAEKVHLPNLKFEVDKRDIDELENVSTDLSNLSYAVENNVVTKIKDIEKKKFLIMINMLLRLNLINFLLECLMID